MDIGKVICPHCGAENLRSPIITTCTKCFGSLQGAKPAPAKRTADGHLSTPTPEKESPPPPLTVTPIPSSSLPEATPLPTPTPTPSAPDLEPPDGRSPEAVAEEPTQEAPPGPPTSRAPSPPVEPEPSPAEPQPIPAVLDLGTPKGDQEVASAPSPPQEVDIQLRTSAPLAPEPAHEESAAPPVGADEPVAEQTPAPTAPAKQICPRCRAGNPPTYRYCAVCGAALGAADAQIACPRCGWENPQGQRACRRCGSALAQAPATTAPFAHTPPSGPWATRRGAAPTMQGKQAAAGCGIVLFVIWTIIVLSHMLR